RSKTCEDGVRVGADVVMRPEVEREPHRVAIAFSEQRPDVDLIARLLWTAHSPLLSVMSSVAAVTLLFPRVAVVVVAVGLPESGLVVLVHLEASYPLGALPEIQVRHEQPRRATVLRLQRLVLVLVGDPRLSVGEIRQRKIRRVAAVAKGEDVFGARID